MVITILMGVGTSACTDNDQALVTFASTMGYAELVTTCAHSYIPSLCNMKGVKAACGCVCKDFRDTVYPQVVFKAPVPDQAGKFYKWKFEKIINTGGHGTIALMKAAPNSDVQPHPAALENIVIKIQVGQGDQALYPEEVACMEAVGSAVQAGNILRPGMTVESVTQACAPIIGCELQMVNDEAKGFPNQQMYAMAPFPSGTTDLLYIIPFLTDDEAKWVYKNLFKIYQVTQARDLVHGDSNLNNFGITPEGQPMAFDFTCAIGKTDEGKWGITYKFNFEPWARSPFKGITSEEDPQYLRMLNAKDWRSSDHWRLYSEMMGNTKGNKESFWAEGQALINEAKVYDPLTDAQYDTMKQAIGAKVVQHKGRDFTQRVCDNCGRLDRRQWCKGAMYRVKMKRDSNGAYQYSEAVRTAIEHDLELSAPTKAAYSDDMQIQDMQQLQCPNTPTGLTAKLAVSNPTFSWHFAALFAAGSLLILHQYSCAPNKGDVYRSLIAEDIDEI